ncbi:4Fe-4S dicluster domain-containing protein [Chlorobium sp. N1]|uniref:4Fe-4S dicluster domain-containing protein n=1 Tax=Chlorobium sp. N1 TaxID=2491138 RepID=UPI00103A2EDC|nr:4Fe-4S dicluster domain-containing protein [Chlorobium sp. N1]TCD47435.1 4Fe-4S dicluster domain-containing protein [Chlorobium sp. N1]
MATLLYLESLSDCFASWRKEGLTVLAPVGEGALSGFREVERAEEANFDLLITRTTLKELFFPRTEPMLGYRIGKREIETEEFMPPVEGRIIFGARACDSAAMAIDDALFDWDYHDEYWFRRRESSVVFTIACREPDEFCMCTSLGLSPDSAKGSDVLLRPLEAGNGWQVEPVTDRGHKALSSIEQHLREGSGATAAPAEVPVKFDLEACRSWLANKENFESPFWREISERCIGCGSCTYLCPTCHCFDIQDEGDTYQGIRRKNWDSCSFQLFTMHTSGHNPRATQGARWRQRIMHKFNYYGGKFDVDSCTGCGRCTRECPVDMGVTETLQTIAAKQKQSERT